MSQITTTIEQSKWLLSAGLCPNSADMSWHKYGTSKWDLWVGYYDRHISGLQVIPAWSLSRLIDISGMDMMCFLNSAEAIEYMVHSIIALIEDGDINPEFLKDGND